MKKNIIGLALAFLCLYFSLSFPVHAAADSGSLVLKYQEYCQRFDAIITHDDIDRQGFDIIEEHIFSFELRDYGEVTFIPALDRQYHRLGVFIVNGSGRVLYKTEQLETNNQNRGELKQPNKGLAAVSFQDVNGDRQMDILLITFCESSTGSYADQTYKVGDVLFQQSSAAKQTFYRDYRISDTINQYGMNKSIKFMTSYLVEGYSTEFLYTSTTLEDLLSNGFEVSNEQERSWHRFEKWGRLEVVPGSYQMAEYRVFMFYLVNEQGNIVWSFQPMREYESLYSLKGIRVTDLDGDGMKDIVVLAGYLYEQTDNQSSVRRDYSVYYQRTGGFDEDYKIKNKYRSSNEETLTQLTEQIHKYWGWN